MRKISYKCNSCGGQLEINSNNNLVCKYCNKIYDKYVKINDVKVENIIEKLRLYNYTCTNCGYVSKMSFSESGNTLACPQCKKEIKEESVLVNGLIPNELIQGYIPNDFKGEIEEIKEFVPTEFLSSFFDLKYITSKLYDGIVEISATGPLGNKIIKKYAVFDLIIPDSNTMNYSDKFEFICNRVKTVQIKIEKNEVIESLSSNNIAVCFDKTNDIDSIEKACLTNFKKENPTANDIKVSTNIDVKYNLLVPIFQSKTFYNGQTYYNHIVGFKDKNRDGSNFCLNFPQLNEIDYNNATNKYRISKFKYYFSLVLIFLLILILSVIIVKEVNIPIFTVLSIVILALIVFNRHERYKSNRLKKQISVYLNPNKLSKEEFFEKIIEEKNNIIRHITWR